MNQEEIAFLLGHNIVILSPIASGGYGSIFLVYHNQYNNQFALKKVPEFRFKEEEIECLQTIDDPKIVSLYQYYKYDHYVYMLMEFCPNDVDRMVAKTQIFPQQELQLYVYEMITALKICHDKHIAHCDVKPSNFMVDKYGRIKIGDFGLSLILDENETSHNYRGTLVFMAPEIIRRETYNPLVSDIWSLGVTLFYFATHSYPFASADNNYLKQKIISGEYPLEKIEDKQLADVIASCLVLDPNQRATVNQLLQMPYFWFAQARNRANRGRASHKDYKIRSQCNIMKPKIERQSLNVRSSFKAPMNHLRLSYCK